MIELRALGEGAVSISCCDLSVHASGGLQRLSWSHEVRGKRCGKRNTGCKLLHLSRCLCAPVPAAAGRGLPAVGLPWLSRTPMCALHRQPVSTHSGFTCCYFRIPTAGR